MDIPKPLRVVSIVLVVLGIIRIVAGILGLIGLRGFFSENPDLITQVIIENFVAGPLILISGLLLLKGKAIGRILLVVAVVGSWIASFVISKEYSIGTLIIFSAIIAILFLEDKIKQYFADKA
ncbi:hypothetical protein CLV62_102146 [Dysgonomonas alginatilytica]|uniref:DoxX-like protein n=1 Tax=Dysgonomonas alginatilytica TaxID=1605892 RepID=A0A2V3PV00_9BACT|nr:hypothetical protein [Dysgonomonas alginatilytica]PXV68114.1 hypothetical protein CLV62_102146 [Dysgonomonas alginatilytica]